MPQAASFQVVIFDSLKKCHYFCATQWRKSPRGARIVHSKLG
jgi:hypothetical protein